MDIVASLSPVSSLLSDEDDIFSVRNEGAGGTPFARRTRSARTSGSSLRLSPDGRSQRDDVHDGLSPLTLSPSKTAASSRRHSGRFGWSNSPQVSPGWSMRAGGGSLPVVSPLTLSPSSCPPTAPMSRRMSRGAANALSPLSLSPRSAAARSLGTTRRQSRTGASEIGSPRSGRHSRRVSFTFGIPEISEATPTKSSRGARNFQSRRAVLQDIAYDEPLSKKDLDYRRFWHLRSELQLADATLRRTKGKLSQMAELCASLQSENDWLTAERAHYVEHALSNSVSMSAVEADATDAVEDEKKEGEGGDEKKDEEKREDRSSEAPIKQGLDDCQVPIPLQETKDLELEVANLTAQILDLRRELSVAQEQQQSAESKATELKDQLGQERTQREQEREARRRRNSEATVAVRELESRLEIANGALAAERQHSEELQKRLEAELVSLTDVSWRLSQMESRDDSQEEKVKAMASDLERLTRALNEERKKSEEFSRQNLAAEARAQELEAELAHYWSAALVPAASPFAVRMASTRTSSAAPSPDFFPTPPPDIAGAGSMRFSLLGGHEGGEAAAAASSLVAAAEAEASQTAAASAAARPETETAVADKKVEEGKAAVFSPLKTATPLPRFLLPSPSFGEHTPEDQGRKIEVGGSSAEATDYPVQLAEEKARVEELQLQLAATESTLAQLRIQLAATSEESSSPLATATSADDPRLSETKFQQELVSLLQRVEKSALKENSSATEVPEDLSRSAKLSAASLRLLRRLAPLILWSAIQSGLSVAWTCAFPESTDLQEERREHVPRSFELLGSGREAAPFEQLPIATSSGCSAASAFSSEEGEGGSGSGVGPRGNNRGGVGIGGLGGIDYDDDEEEGSRCCNACPCRSSWPREPLPLPLPQHPRGR
mmetsp:Transcript_57442/g.122194  ORF Transcript_57442/g.122194 Transcript_57442/m.122194 type:complete len:896 (-) Transcript_57442:440-3127(-)